MKDLNLNTDDMASLIDELNRDYDNDGKRIEGLGYKKIQNQIKKRFHYDSLVLTDSLEEKAIRKNSENRDDKSYPYIQKRRAIINVTDEYADLALFPHTECSHKKELFQQLQMYYLAFKVIRNHSNHANGMGGINVILVCTWLNEQGILPINKTRINENTIRLDYAASDALLKNAITFNKTDLLGVIEQNSPD